VKIPWRTLGTRLSKRQRQSVAAGLRGLLSWQRDLCAWVAPASVPDATAFVALYAHGRLRGCFGSDEGRPGERLARAFLRALMDIRFGGIGSGERSSLVAEVSYVTSVRARSFDRLMTDLETGTHGVGLLSERGAPVVLLPSVARDGGLTTAQLLDVLARKAGLADAQQLRRLETFLFETDAVVCRMGGPRARVRDTRDQAAKWLSEIVSAEGEVLFAVDGRTGMSQKFGPMHHGRAAAALQALARHGGYPREVARGLRRLERDIREGLAGRAPPGWPTDPFRVGGTLALALLAGANVEAELAQLARENADLGRVPWHAAQVVAALGPKAPAPLWQACVASLEREPWAPWTVLAARARGDRVVLERAEPALVSSVREASPHVGGVAEHATTHVPEIAITALTAEALAGSPDHAARAAVRRARAFLQRWQITERGPACAATTAFGAFPASPVSMLLRGDMTGHALGALL
jgi:AMMECR1 domain-containing protein